MGGYSFQAFGTKHVLYLLGLVLVYWAFIWAGRRTPDLPFRRRVALALILFSLSQEILDDILRMTDGIWTVQNDLPLHLCSLAMVMGVYALATKRQLGFEVAYYWSLAAASQALITPDPTPWTRELHVFWNFISHGVVVLNVLWLFMVEGMRCRRGSWLKVLGITNLMLIPMAFFNWLFQANYFFIREKPGGSSPFLVGDWPWYILWFEALALIFFFLFYVPMWWVERRERRSGMGRGSGAGAPPSPG